MIAIEIGAAERRDGDFDARWVTDQVNLFEKPHLLLFF